MKKLEHIKNKAIQLRHEGYSLPDICKLLGRSKGTVHYWLKGIPLQRQKLPPNIKAMVNGNARKWKSLKEKAYAEGLQIFEDRKHDMLFRDFIVIFLTEGYRKSINTVEVTNTNYKMIKLSKKILEEFSIKITFRVYYHEDRDQDRIKDFWARELEIDRSQIKTHLKKSTGNLKNRSQTCDNGIMHLNINDFTLRSKVQAWMDSVEKEWNA